MQWSKEAARGALAVLLVLALLSDLGLASWVGWGAWRASQGVAPVALALNDAQKTAPTRPLILASYQTSSASGVRRVDWGLTGAEWQKTAQGARLRLSFGETKVVSTGVHYGTMSAQEGRSLCQEVLAKLPPGAPDGLRSDGITRVEMRVLHGKLPDERAALENSQRWSDWLAFHVVDGQCVGTARPATQEVLMSRAIERHYIARRGVWFVERESWVRENDAFQYRLWVKSARRIARDVPIALSPVTAWTLCSSVLEALPSQRPWGVERDDISVVAFHMPGEQGGWVSQAVENGICRLPDEAERDDWLRSQ